MKNTDRTLFEAFSSDERTIHLRKIRSALEARFDESLQLIYKLESGEESLNLNSIIEAKNGLLRAFQIEYAIRSACAKIYGHEQVIAKIQLNLDEKLRKAATYMNQVNSWVSRIEEAGINSSK